MTPDREALEIYGGGLSPAYWRRITNRLSVYYPARIFLAPPVFGSSGGGSFRGTLGTTTTKHGGAGGAGSVVFDEV